MLRAISIFVIQLAVVLAGSDYGVPVEIQLWDTGRSPLDHMVDVTNQFGLKVLAEHNFLNDNNIAFSPYGLTGIMVALYEGVDGESSYQIQRGMQLPWNRNVMRVGFRDIHRTLKTYFVPEEGFLAGLALNNENVTFNDNYKKVLRFYGFDLDNDQLPTLPPQANNSTNATANDTTPTTMPAREETATASSATPEIEETTPRPSTESSTDVDIRIPTSSTASPSSAPNAESTSTEVTTAQQTAPPSPTAPQIMSTNSETTTDSLSTVSSEPKTTTSVPMTNPPTTIESTISIETTINNEVELLSTSKTTSVAENLADSTISTTVAPETTETPTIETTGTNTESNKPTDTTQTIKESTLETLERKKKSIVDFIFTNPPYIQDLGYHRAFDIGPDIGDKPFLVNGLRNMQVTYMQYDTILEHAYLPHLEASALRLPLDSDRYYLLVVLPSRTGPAELSRLIARMARESDLRDVHATLRPKRIRALVPSFTVKGHVTLTTDLQKLGIRDVFEPRQRDFTPMTSGAGVYVRSVEQAVSVAIRKYRPDDHKRNRYVNNRYPIHFSATYPFLYFVMDSSIHVALMAGKMVDPLNTRVL